MRISRLVAVAAALLFGAGAAMAQMGDMGPFKMGQTSAGMIMVDAKGMTLYTYDRDTEANKSSCTGTCLTNWPAVIAAADAKAVGKLTVITREDGVKQWAYGGKPLYYFARDMKAGDVVGDNPAGVWHVIKN